MTWFGFVLLSLATFRLTHLLVYDTITSFLRNPFIEVEEVVADDGVIEEIISVKGKGIRRVIGELLSCYWCTGVWSATILFVAYTLLPTVVYPVVIILALAGVASIIQVIVNRFLV